MFATPLPKNLTGKTRFNVLLKKKILLKQQSQDHQAGSQHSQTPEQRAAIQKKAAESFAQTKSMDFDGKSK